ncbi:putative Protein pirA [Paratrimastix pyriformis]|uniref:CYRIA/CYRIB Rac1 binding domain-containing protein n=1 Tax=Paratrimastix pyriformis TaxID=342808 RepID=A0ABQ8UC67_9EUKA|nr:putative Protein pirA [Paratrimastix pyriformis]
MIEALVKSEPPYERAVPVANTAPMMVVEASTSGFSKMQDALGYNLQVRDESELIALLDDWAGQSQEIVSILYTHRSVALPLGQAHTTGMSPEAKQELDRQHFALLDTEIRKIRDQVFLKVMKMNDIFYNVIDALVKLDPKKDIPSEQLLLAMVRYLDGLVQINEIKNIKASLSNDLLLTYVRKTEAAFENLDPEQRLYLFLGEQNRGILDLRDALRRILGVLAYCLVLIDGAVKITKHPINPTIPQSRHPINTNNPKEKKALAVGAVSGGAAASAAAAAATDSVTGGAVLGPSCTAPRTGRNVFKYRELHWDKAREFLQRYPYIHVCDVYRDLYDVIQLAAHMHQTRFLNMPSCGPQAAHRYNADHMFKPKYRIPWTLPAEGTSDYRRLQAAYTLASREQADRTAVDQFMARWTLLLAEVRACEERNAADPSRPPVPPPTPLSRAVSDHVIAGALLVGDLSAALLEQAAWKAAHPASNATVGRLIQEQAAAEGGAASSAADVTQFERVVRYNYDRDERTLLCQYLIWIRLLTEQLAGAAALVRPVLQRCMHDEVKTPCLLLLCLVTLVCPAACHSRGATSYTMSVLLTLREHLADWQSSRPYLDDPMYSGRKDREKNFKVPQPGSRALAPALTQLSLARAAVYTLACEQAPGQQGGLFSDKDLVSDDAEIYLRFYARTGAYPVLMEYPDGIAASSSVALASLWFRELYLEAAKTREQVVQFPIETSLPWILTEHLLTPPSPGGDCFVFEFKFVPRNFGVLPLAAYPPLAEDVLAPLSLYADAAQLSLGTLHCAYLYGEVEAEADLALKQLFYRLGDAVFAHTRKIAAGLLLEEAYRAPFETLPPAAPGAASSAPATGKAGRRNRVAALRTRYAMPFPWWDALLTPRRQVALLGRAIDLSGQLARRLDRFFEDNLTAVMQTFLGATADGQGQATDPVGSLVGLDRLLGVIELSHELLVAHGLPLVPWQTLWDRLAQNESLFTFHTTLVDQPLTQAHRSIVLASSHFFGLHPHLAALVHLLTNYTSAAPALPPSHHGAPGYPPVPAPTLPSRRGAASSAPKEVVVQGSPAIVVSPYGVETMMARGHLVAVVRGVLDGALEKVRESVVPVAREIIATVLPRNFKLPSFMWKTQGCYEYFVAQGVKEVTRHPRFHGDLLKGLASLGNALCLLQLMDEAMTEAQVTAVLQCLPCLQSFLTNPALAAASNRESPLGTGPAPTASPPPPLSDAGRNVPSDQMVAYMGEAVRPRPLVIYALAQIHVALNTTTTSLPLANTPKSVPLSTLPWPAQSVAQTQLVEAAQQALKTMPPAARPAHVALPPCRNLWQEYGDGLLWGGCSVIHLLGQRHCLEVFDGLQHLLFVDRASAPPGSTAVLEQEGPDVGEGGPLVAPIAGAFAEGKVGCR